MAKSKEAHEFVLVDEHSTIVSDLNKTSADVQGSVNTSIEAAELHNQKQDLVVEALEIIKEIQSHVRDFKKEVPIKKLPGKRRVKVRPKSRPTKVRTPTADEEHEFLQRSQKALGHLQRNITDLKTELRRVK